MHFGLNLILFWKLKEKFRYLKFQSDGEKFRNMFEIDITDAISALNPRIVPDHRNDYSNHSSWTLSKSF